MSAIRDIAIIAHVDHGKTTLVDAMLQQSGLLRENKVLPDQVMDSHDLERERGITILAKNTAIRYGEGRINIVDTPGHADFGGEVERVLKMVDGVILLVDAAEGPMPQTRFVLRKALEMELVPIVVINKIDRKDARVAEVEDEIYELFMALGATESQIDFPILYAVAKAGLAFTELPAINRESLPKGTITPLLDAVFEHIPAPQGALDAPLKLLVSNIAYDPYLGKLAIGRVEAGVIRKQQSLVVANEAGERPGKVAGLHLFEGLGRKEVEEASVGEIVCLSGLDEVAIGDSLCDPEHVERLPFVRIDEPTIAMRFQVNDSPMAGLDGSYVTSRHLRERLEREMLSNVSMRLEDTERPECFLVKGRGELQIAILIENMRREGYEFQVSRPEVVAHEDAGTRYEPEELLMIDVPEAYAGVVIEQLGRRKAEMIEMSPPIKGSLRMQFKIPTRSLIGYRSSFLTDTRGNGIMHASFAGYIPWKGALQGRGHGVLLAHEAGTAVSYGLYHAQERGQLFIGPGTEVYEGMIVGTTQRQEDIIVNVCRRKHATNIRAAGSDEALRLSPPLDFSLEQCLEFIADDEWIEVTPKHTRMRKMILNAQARLRALSRKKHQADAKS